LQKNLQETCRKTLFEQPKMQHSNDLLGFNEKKIIKAQKTLSIYVKTLLKITPTLKIDLVFKYMLSTKILVQLAI
jgi:hypothetical protein